MRLRRFIPVLVGLLATVGTMVAGPLAPLAAQSAGPAYAHLGATPLPGGFAAIEVDAATQRVFVSSPTSSVVTVTGPDGQVLGSISVPGAGSLLLDGATLYVASTTAGHIDTFSTTTLAPTGSYGAGTIVKPNTLAKAGGRIWTTTDGCGGGVQLVSFVPGTATVTVHPGVQSLSYCPLLFSSPVDPNQLLGFDAGLSPGTAVRLDVSSGVPVATGSFWDMGSNTKDLEILPGGQHFAVASGWPYEIPTFTVNPLQRHGVVYPTGDYPNAVDSTASRGGLLAAGRDGTYSNDIDVFRLGDPSQTLFRHDFGDTSNTLHDRGLAFGPDGTKLFAVSGGSYTGTMLNVFGPPEPGGRYTPLTPARILDTRTGAGGLPGRIGSGATADVQVSGRGGVPEAGVAAVAMNVTVTGPTAGGFLTIFPAGTARPLASNLNFSPGQTVPNLVVVKVGDGGKVSMFNSAGATDVVYDVAGYFSEAGVASASSDEGRYTALVPARILDTRTGAGGGVRLAPGESLDVQVGGRGGVPDGGAAAAVLNVAATGTTATSYLTVHPTGEPRPLAANLNFVAGDTVSNRAMVKLGAGGNVTVYNNAGSTDVVVDVGGWFSSASATPGGGTYTALAPARILDTRDDTGSVTGPLPAGVPFAVQVTGRGAVPATGVSAVILNTTMVDAAGPGYVTIYPSGAVRPLASDLNYAAGETRPNLAVVRVGDAGMIELFTSAGGHLVIDVAGWIS